MIRKQPLEPGAREVGSFPALGPLGEVSGQIVGPFAVGRQVETDLLIIALGAHAD